MIKPKIFIGSSSERLNIAYAIQENLEYDSEPTVWSQSVFELTKSALDSLIDSLNDFDFAIFAFHPDDIVSIREKRFEVVRDNLIFELGLFMGSLGKNNVFFLIPKGSEHLHLPTDLLGITPGTYDSERSDKNLKASLGPFCNQVRERIKKFVYLNIEGFKNDIDSVKDIVITKPRGWEFILAVALLKQHIDRIEENYKDIEEENLVQRLKVLDGNQLLEWFSEVLQNIDNYIKHLVKGVKAIHKSFGDDGVPGKAIEIKTAINNLVLLCDELLFWETEMQRIKPPEELTIVKSKFKGSTKSLVLVPLKEMMESLEKIIDKLDNPIIDKEEINITITPKFPKIFATISEDFKNYLT